MTGQRRAIALFIALLPEHVALHQRLCALLQACNQRVHCTQNKCVRGEISASSKHSNSNSFLHDTQQWRLFQARQRSRTVVTAGRGVADRGNDEDPHQPRETAAALQSLQVSHVPHRNLQAGLFVAPDLVLADFAERILEEEQPRLCPNPHPCKYT
eukprot:4307434-Pleurochrysis_carterae.AAC.2